MSFSLPTLLICVRLGAAGFDFGLRLEVWQFTCSTVDKNYYEGTDCRVCHKSYDGNFSSSADRKIIWEISKDLSFLELLSDSGEDLQIKFESSRKHLESFIMEYLRIFEFKKISGVHAECECFRESSL